MLIFENPGNLDLTAATTLGVNVKEGETPIGYFGTGLKYAVAWTLRTGHSILVQPGDGTEIPFQAREETIRGKPFQIIHLSSQKLGFTTELGKNWEPWQAFREFLCNALDEGGSYYLQSNHADHPPATIGITRIIICGAELEKVHRDDVVLPEGKQPAFLLGPDLEVYEGLQTKFHYYRGIRIMERRGTCNWHFNFLDHMALTEDRTPKYSWSIEDRILQGLKQIDLEDPQQRKLARAYCTAKIGNVLHDIYPTADLCNKFLPILKELQAERAAFRQELVQQTSELHAANLRQAPARLSRHDQRTLDQAISLLKRQGYAVDNYPIHVSDKLPEGQLGLAVMTTKEIFLSKQCFELGDRSVISTLLEEFTHLDRNLGDNCYPMQNYLFSEIVRLLQELDETGAGTEAPNSGASNS